MLEGSHIQLGLVQSFPCGTLVNTALVKIDNSLRFPTKMIFFGLILRPSCGCIVQLRGRNWGRPAGSPGRAHTKKTKAP